MTEQFCPSPRGANIFFRKFWVPAPNADNLPGKNCVLEVKMRLFLVGDEKLRSVCVRTVVSHRHYSSFCVLKQKMQTKKPVSPITSNWKKKQLFKSSQRFVPSSFRWTHLQIFCPKYLSLLCQFLQRIKTTLNLTNRERARELHTLRPPREIFNINATRKHVRLVLSIPTHLMIS